MGDINVDDKTITDKKNTLQSTVREEEEWGGVGRRDTEAVKVRGQGLLGGGGRRWRANNAVVKDNKKTRWRA